MSLEGPFRFRVQGLGVERFVVIQWCMVLETPKPP